MALSIHDTNLLQKYFADKPVKRVYLSGSYARNTAIDLLHNKVDVVTSDGLSKYVQPYIDKGKILI